MRELPEGDGWAYEPKWDGFRGVLENLDGELALWSRNERPLLRYFPELRPARRAAAAALGARRRGGDRPRGRARLRRDADAPPPGRVADPAAVRRDPGAVRRRSTCSSGTASRSGSGRSRSGAPSSSGSATGFRLSPSTRELAEARGWLDRFESLGLDGVVAKRLGVPYLPGSRDGRRQGEGAQDAPTASSSGSAGRGRATRSRRCCSASTATTAGSTTSARAPSPRRREPRSRRRCCRSSRSDPEWQLVRAEPLGHRRRSRRRASGPSSWSRCATTRCRATASATARS